MKQIKIKSKVSKFTGDRKIVEIPKAARDNFRPGEEVNIEKIPKDANKRRRGL